MEEKKLIYILNHYAHHGSSHFFHAIHLLEKMAASGVQIVLIIEKAEDIPIFQHGDIQVISLRKGLVGRTVGLFRELIRLNKAGYKKIYVRISWLAAVIAILAGFFTGQKGYFWKSGQGIIEAYRSLRPGIRKIRYWFRHILPFWFIRTFIYRLVTGPETMKSYYVAERKLAPEKVLILYNDIDTVRFSPCPPADKRTLRAELGLDLDKKIILFVHHMSPIRRTNFYLPWLLRTFIERSDHDDVFFIIAGDGPERTGIIDAVNSIARLKGKTIFPGALPNAGIEKWFRAADLFIQPSFAEGFPRTLLEAMACGLPVVTTDAGGTRDILGPGQLDLMTKKENRQAFLDNMVRLLKDEESMIRLGKENRERALQFSTERIAAMYISALFDPGQ